MSPTKVEVTLSSTEWACRLFQKITRLFIDMLHTAAWSVRVKLT